MEGTCEYIERAVADSRQKVAFQLGGCEGANNPPPPHLIELYTLRIIYNRHGNGRNLWHDLITGKRVWVSYVECQEPL
jgi:hypothetical protein